jgi:hypothetical protein
MFVKTVNIKWRGDFYDVAYEVSASKIEVNVNPPNDELNTAVTTNIARDSHGLLSLYFGFGEYYLRDDPKRGTA